MNAIAERWTGGCRRELLDRTLIWNQAHLRRILCQYETHHNQHRPHRSLNSVAPLKPLPEPVDLERYHVRRHARISGMVNEYRLVACVNKVLGTHTSRWERSTYRYGLRRLPLCPACAAALAGEVYQRPGAERARAIGRTAA